MINFQKKIVVDEMGHPKEIIIPYEQFLELEEILGIDLEDEVKEHLKTAKFDRESDREDSYINLDVTIQCAVK